MGAVFDIAIGLVFTYLLLSLLCSAVQESIAWLLSLRSAALKQGIENLLDDEHLEKTLLAGETIASRVYDHPLIDGLRQPTLWGWLRGGDAASNPSYISAPIFVSALLDRLKAAAAPALEVLPRASEGVRRCVAAANDGELVEAAKRLAADLGDADLRNKIFAAAAPLASVAATLDRVQTAADQASRDLAALEAARTIRELSAAFASGTLDVRRIVGALPSQSVLRQRILALLDQTVKDADDARRRLEQWFDDSMDRVSGLYKRAAHAVILLVALGVTVAINADTVGIAQRLWRDGTLRASLVAAAEQAAHTPPQPAGEPNLRAVEMANITNQIQSLRIPLGWSDWTRPSDWEGWTSWVFGLIVTVLALSLGAPFWFDTLGKLVNLRSSGPPPVRS